MGFRVFGHLACNGPSQWRRSLCATHSILANKRRRQKKQRNKRVISHFIHTGAHTFFCSKPIRLVSLLLCFIIIIISAIVLNAKMKSWNVLTDFVAVFARTDFCPLIFVSLLYLHRFCLTYLMLYSLKLVVIAYTIYTGYRGMNMNVLLFCECVYFFFFLSEIINNHEMWPYIIF